MKKIIALVLLAAFFVAFTPLNGAADSPSDEMLKSAAFLMKMRQEFEKTRKNFSTVSDSMLSTYEELRNAKEKTKTLREQIQEIDAAIASRTAHLKTVLLKMRDATETLANLQDNIEARQAAIQQEQKFAADYLRMLSMKKRLTQGSWNMLLAENSVEGALREQTYFTLLEETARRLIKNLETAERGFETLKQELIEKQNEHRLLKEEITRAREELESEKQNKVELLKATHGQEKAYQAILTEARRMQEEIFRDIQTLRSNLKKIEQRYAAAGKLDELKQVIDEKLAAIFELQRSFDGQAGTWQWPVSPAGGLSALFHDGAYQKRFGVTHNAIDIRVLMNTPVRAPMDGVVFKLHEENGNQYSYLILAHADGFMTVYGHLSEILVEDGQTVKQGDLIAYSGGKPGTKGAGFLTTGPHLHVEILKDGRYVDPLLHLPLEYVPLESLPEKYLLLAKEQKESRPDEKEKTVTNEEIITNVEALERER